MGSILDAVLGRGKAQRPHSAPKARINFSLGHRPRFRDQNVNQR